MHGSRGEGEGTGGLDTFEKLQNYSVPYQCWSRFRIQCWATIGPPFKCRLTGRPMKARFK